MKAQAKNTAPKKITKKAVVKKVAAIKATDTTISNAGIILYK